MDMRKAKKYKCTESNVIVLGRHHAIQCDLCGQWHVIYII